MVMCAVRGPAREEPDQWGFVWVLKTGGRREDPKAMAGNSWDSRVRPSLKGPWSAVPRAAALSPCPGPGVCRGPGDPVKS